MELKSKLARQWGDGQNENKYALVGTGLINTILQEVGTNTGITNWLITEWGETTEEYWKSIQQWFFVIVAEE